MADNSIPPPHIPLVNPDGTVTTQWYRYLARTESTANAASSGEVLGDGGLTGGGAVSDGVTLSIASDGVSDAMLRESAALSVIGRYLNSVGNPSDIMATADKRVLARQSDMLVFAGTPELDGVIVDTFEMTPAATVSAATPSTHKIAVTIGGAAYFILLTT